MVAPMQGLHERASLAAFFIKQPRLRTWLEASIVQSQDLEDIGIVLSLRDDLVWASWRDDRAPVVLGDHRAVLSAMHDFIRQSEIGERLVNKGLNAASAKT